MPQLNAGDGDDLGANDELISFKDEGEHEEKRNVAAERDLDDVKSSLVNESETNSSSDSEVSQLGLVNQLLPIITASTLAALRGLVGAYLSLFTFMYRQTDAPSPIQIWRGGPDTVSSWKRRVMNALSTLLLHFDHFDSILSHTLTAHLK